ncbi:MAG: FAD-binding oxidoreductase [Dehalococcoidia bacterium]
MSDAAESALRPAEGDDAVDGVAAAGLIEPGTVEELSEVLAWANDGGLAIWPRGGGARMRWGCTPDRPGLVLSTGRLASIVEHAWADLTVTVEAGVSLAALQQALGERGQQLAIDPRWPERTTIGGLIASDDSGPLRLRYGGVRDLLLGVTVVRADGVIARGGGKVVKNVAGYDLPKLFTGSLGTLGVVVAATFRLHPLPEADVTLVYEAPGPAGLLLRIVHTPVSPAALSAVARKDGRVLVRLAGDAAGVRAEIKTVTAAVGAPSARLEGESAVAAWRETGEAPWIGDGTAAVCRLSVLPSEIPALLAAVSGCGLPSVTTIHAHGLGFLRLEGDVAALDTTIRSLRAAIGARDGTLVVLDAPPALKKRIDIWGLAPGSLPLMQRVRERFDPKGILNPGRLVPLGGNA